MCGVSPSAAPDMTGLGGKVRTVPSSNTTTSTGEGESAGEGAGAEVSFEHTTDNLLHEVSTACIMLLFTCSAYMYMQWLVCLYSTCFYTTATCTSIVILFTYQYYYCHRSHA